MGGRAAIRRNVDDPRGFLAKPRWQRLIIAFAGPLMNMVLAVALLTGLYMVKFQKVADEDMQAVIGHVMGIHRRPRQASGQRPASCGWTARRTRPGKMSA